MSNPNKRKGTQWEVDLLPALRTVFPEAERSPRWGAKDKGDFTGTWPFVFEAKNRRDINLADFVDQAVEQANNRAEDMPDGDKSRLFGAAVVKRRRKSPDEGYVVMRLVDFLTMVKDLMYNEF